MSGARHVVRQSRTADAPRRPHVRRAEIAAWLAAAPVPTPPVALPRPHVTVALSDARPVRTTKRRVPVPFATVASVVLGVTLVTATFNATVVLPGHVLGYHNGPVEHHPRIHLIFWGSGWNDHRALIQDEESVVRDLSGSHYTAVLTQYGDGSGPISTDFRLVGTWVDPDPPPVSVTESAISDEINRARLRQRWGPIADAQYVLLMAPGSGYLPDGCAYHQWTGPWGIGPLTGNGYVYSLIPYPDDAPGGGCDPAGNVVDALTVATTHEVVESATDPAPIFPVPGWVTSHGEEVADLCRGKSATLDGWAVASLWSERDRACVDRTTVSHSSATVVAG